MTSGFVWLLGFTVVTVTAVFPIPSDRLNVRISSEGLTGRHGQSKAASGSLARREELREVVLESPTPLSTLPNLQSQETRPAAYNDALMQAVRDNLSKYRNKVDAQAAGTSNLASEAKHHSIGAIVVLLDTSDIMHMHDIRNVLVPSLMDHIKFRTSVVVFFTGSRRRAEDATINLHLNTFLTLRLEDVTDRIHQFSNDELQICKKGKQSDDWKINQFWTMHVHKLPELQVFKYAWRLLPSSSIDADITADLYEVMKSQNAVFGFRSLRNEKMEVCGGLEDATKKFFKEHTALSPQMLNSKTYLSLFEEARCPSWSPDFQITDLDYLRSSGSYQQFVRHLSHMGGFCKFGWGGHGIQALFIETQEPGTQRLLCTKPWVPKFHGPMASIDCQEGQSLIAFLRDAINDQLHAPQASMGEVQEVKRNTTTKAEKVGHPQASAVTMLLVHALAFVLHLWRRWKLYISILLVLGFFGVVNIVGYIYLRNLRIRQKHEKEAERDAAERAVQN
mmetsp:Transcript_7778/g.14452  ORF Transcript_7778/g.14452 Transcript_7778/m.14452 type:complete len:506 (+) Transcript_7778:113-1630(+)